MGLGGGGSFVALAHHHPAAIFEHDVAMLVAARRAHVDRAGLLVGILLKTDHFRHRGDRIARIDRLHEPAIGIAQIGDRIERDFRRGLAEDDVERQHVVERRARIADGLGEFVRRLDREARAIERRIQRHVTQRHGARGGMLDHLTEAKILKEVACVGLRALHPVRPLCMRS